MADGVVVTDEQRDRARRGIEMQLKGLFGSMAELAEGDYDQARKELGEMGLDAFIDNMVEVQAAQEAYQLMLTNALHIRHGFQVGNGVGHELLFSYSVREDEKYNAEGHLFIGVGKDPVGREMHVFIKVGQ